MRERRFRKILKAVLAALGINTFGALGPGSLGGASSAQAAQDSWLGDGDGVWSDASAWSNPPTSGDSLYFNTNAGVTVTSDDISTFTNCAGITFDSSAGAFSLNAGSGFPTMWMSGDIVNNSTNAEAVNFNFTLNTANANLNASSGNLNIGGVIAGAGKGLTVTGCLFSGVRTLCSLRA